jgi:hypothetical protein
MSTRLASVALALVVHHLTLSPILACADTAVPERPYYNYAYGKRFAFTIKESDAFKLAWSANADHSFLAFSRWCRLSSDFEPSPSGAWNGIASMRFSPLLPLTIQTSPDLQWTATSPTDQPAAWRRGVAVALGAW